MLSGGAKSLAAFRFLLGIGEAANWPASVKVVTEWFPQKERALASGIFNSGSSVGAILAPPLVAGIVLAFGWRAAFLAVGMLGFVWLCVWWPLYRAPGTAALPVASATAAKIPVRQLLRDRFVWKLLLAKVFLDPVWYFYTFWFPEYLKHARHFDLAAIGKFAWIPFFIAGLGNLLGGWLSAHLVGRGFTMAAARRSAIAVFITLMTAAIPAVLVGSTVLSVALVSVAMVGYTGCLANLLAVPADRFPSDSVGSVWGLASMGAGAGGMLFALLTGIVVDHASYVPVFFGFGLMPLISLAILWRPLGRRP
jgi:ACS family hexuronate transporter-like MFS transporter